MKSECKTKDEKPVKFPVCFASCDHCAKCLAKILGMACCGCGSKK